MDINFNSFKTSLLAKLILIYAFEFRRINEVDLNQMDLTKLDTFFAKDILSLLYSLLKEGITLDIGVPRVIPDKITGSNRRHSGDINDQEENTQQL